MQQIKRQKDKENNFIAPIMHDIYRCIEETIYQQSDTCIPEGLYGGSGVKLNLR